MVASLLAEGARFLVVGAHAMAVHGVPRATGDLDVWIPPDDVNADKVWRALERFGAPLEAVEISPADLRTPDTVIQIGLPPRRIDLLTGLTAIDFDAAWEDRVLHKIDDLTVPFQNKRATGRLRDLADLEALERR